MANDKIIVLASQELIDKMKGRLRHSDELECGASCGKRGDDAMQESYNLSEACWVGISNGLPVCVFGVVRTSILSNTGVPWLLATPEFEEEGLDIVRASKTYASLMRKHFRLLVNFVDARQEKSIKWLRWLGFTIEPSQPYGVAGLPFHKFWMKGDL